MWHPWKPNNITKNSKIKCGKFDGKQVILRKIGINLIYKKPKSKFSIKICSMLKNYQKFSFFVYEVNGLWYRLWWIGFVFLSGKTRILLTIISHFYYRIWQRDALSRWLVESAKPEMANIVRSCVYEKYLLENVKKID